MLAWWGRELGRIGGHAPVVFKLALTSSGAEEHESAAARQAAVMTCAVEMAEARPVRAGFGCGQQACQVAS